MRRCIRAISKVNLRSGRRTADLDTELLGQMIDDLLAART
jgi:hypothetical protein